jgi:thiamine biosynthesis protein ThiS
MMMEIKVNNKSRKVNSNSSLIDLLLEMQIIPEKTLISINEEIIPQEAFASIFLKENDAIDLFSFVGGG